MVSMCCLVTTLLSGHMFRFRTTSSRRALLLATRDSSSADRLEISLEGGGKVRAAIGMGITEKKVRANVAML